MGDIDILNFALTLEYLEAAFYEGGREVTGLIERGRRLREDVRRRGAGARRRADARRSRTSAASPSRRRGVDFGDAFSSADKFIQLAITFEDTGVSAYNGAAPMIESKDLLATAGGIVQVEARHAATIRFAAGEDPAPEAFDPTLTEDEVLKAVAAVHQVMTAPVARPAAELRRRWPRR